MRIDTLAQICINSINRGGKIMIAGNGGSATMSSHFSGELVGKYKRNRKALPAISLFDLASFTAIANDFGYEHVFVRQLEALAKPEDVFIALSTSGKSENLINALNWCKENNIIAVDFERVGESTAEIQENQLVALHELADMIEQEYAS